MGDNSDKRNPYNIRNLNTLACTVHKIWNASNSVTDGHTDARTDEPKPICPTNFFKVGGIKMESTDNTFIYLFFLFKDKTILIVYFLLYED